MQGEVKIAFVVDIEETYVSRKSVIVFAESREDASLIVDEMAANGEINLDEFDGLSRRVSVKGVPKPHDWTVLERIVAP